MFDPADIVPRLRQFVTSPPERDFVEFEGRWWTAKDVARKGREIGRLLDDAAVPGDVAIGVVVRTHVESAAALIGLVAAARPITMIQPYQSSSLVARNVTTLNLAVVIAEEEDWTDDLRACLGDGRIGILLPKDSEPPRFVAPLPDTLMEPHRSHPRMVVEVLSSGTTGAPKNIPLEMSALVRGVQMITVAGDNVERQVEFLFAPLTSIGGILPLLAYPLVGARFCMFERFKVDTWVDAVKRHRPKSAGATPAIIRSILEAQVPPEALESIKVMYGGAGPLDMETRKRFAETYDLDLCWGYGATEFAGTLAGWTPKLKAELGGDRPNSVGRALPGIGVRVTDPDTGAELPVDMEGRLEATIPGISEDWIKTNDLGKIDADGIIYVFGRLDGAINRGGFKVLPEVIADALRLHPSVRDAGVIGVAHPRLGEVPLAAVELVRGAVPVTGEDLRAFTRQHLPSPSVPVDVLIFDELPRNAMHKIKLSALRAMCEVPAAK